MRVTGHPFIIDMQTPCPLQYRSISDKFAEARQTVPFRRVLIRYCFLLSGGLRESPGAVSGCLGAIGSR
jgi:hypothetical protein